MGIPKTQAKVLLQPCRLREEHFVPIRDEDPFWMTWDTMLNELVPSRRRDPRAAYMEKQKLRGAKPGNFIGLSRRARGSGNTNFILATVNGKGWIRFVLKRDPSFSDRVLKIFKVVEVDWGCSFQEQKGTIDKETPDKSPRVGFQAQGVMSARRGRRRR